MNEDPFVLEPLIDRKIYKSPLNYIGGKSKLLPQLLPLFPNCIDKMFDVFAGGCNVGINVKANQYFFNDNLTYLIDLYKTLNENDLNTSINQIESRISEFDLSITNQDGYLKFREFYNQTRNPLDLFVLIAFTFNHQIRFNNKHQFNNPFGRNRSSFNEKMKNNLILFINRIKECDPIFLNLDFTQMDFSSSTNNDFIYCDPPYLITTGTYNDGKRGFKGWGENEETQLLNFLDELHNKKLRFGLSNVLFHKGNENHLLLSWLQKNSEFRIHYLRKSYSNSNYQTIIKDDTITVEVYICNYEK